MQHRAVLTLLTCALACTGAGPAPGSAIEPAELSGRLARGAAPVILDVRTPEEFAAGHVPGAVNVPHTELADRLGALDLAQDEEIVVHCEKGGRAAAAEAVLREAGHTNVRDLTGHMGAWREAGYPVE